MSDVEDLLIRTLRDPARALPSPPDPVPAIRARVRSQRRNTVLAVAAVALVTVAAVVAPALLGRGTDPLPPASGAGLLDWAPRGPLAADAELVADAERAWRDGPAPRPAGAVSLLWAGPVGGDRVVVLEGRAADGAALLAQTADLGTGRQGLVRAEPLTDPGIAAVKLATATRTALLVRPGTASVAFLNDSVTPEVGTPVEGVVVEDTDLADRRIAALGPDGRILADGLIPADGLVAGRSTIRLVSPTWRTGGGERLPRLADYIDGKTLAQRVIPATPGTGPVEVAVLDSSVALDVPGGRAEPRFYEVRRAGRTWLGSAVWLDSQQFCLTLADVTGRVDRVDVVELRCWLPPARRGVLAVDVADGVRLAGIDLAAAGPGQRAVRERFRPAIANGFVRTLGLDFPTGPGRISVVDAAGRARPPVELPPYS